MTLNNLNNNTNCVAEIKEADVLQNSMKQMKIQTDSSEVAVDDCGLPCVKLKFFNMFRSPKWFLVFLCMAATIQAKFLAGFFLVKAVPKTLFEWWTIINITIINKSKYQFTHKELNT